MDKKKKIIYSIVLILVVLGLVGLSFYLGTQINKFTDKPKEITKKNKKIVKKSIKQMMKKRLNQKKTRITLLLKNMKKKLH